MLFRKAWLMVCGGLRLSRASLGPRIALISRVEFSWERFMPGAQIRRIEHLIAEIEQSDEVRKEQTVLALREVCDARRAMIAAKLKALESVEP
jgi:hypothetical protein